MDGGSAAELAADARKTEAAVLEHLDRLYAGRDSARLCLCTAEAEALFSALERQGAREEDSDRQAAKPLPACAELQVQRSSRLSLSELAGSSQRALRPAGCTGAGRRGRAGQGAGRPARLPGGCTAPGCSRQQARWRQGAPPGGL